MDKKIKKQTIKRRENYCARILDDEDGRLKSDCIKPGAQNSVCLYIIRCVFTLFDGWFSMKRVEGEASQLHETFCCCCCSCWCCLSSSFCDIKCTRPTYQKSSIYVEPSHLEGTINVLWIHSKRKKMGGWNCRGLGKKKNYFFLSFVRLKWWDAELCYGEGVLL